MLYIVAFDYRFLIIDRRLAVREANEVIGSGNRRHSVLAQHFLSRFYEISSNVAFRKAFRHFEVHLSTRTSTSQKDITTLYDYYFSLSCVRVYINVRRSIYFFLFLLQTTFRF